MTTYYKISWSLEAARFGIWLFQSPEIVKQRCRDTCQISERYDQYNTRCRGFETSREFTVKCIIGVTGLQRKVKVWSRQNKSQISRVHLLWHDDVINWKHFQLYWPFVRGIHRLPVNSPHKGQWRGALMFSLIFAWKKWLSKQSRRLWFEVPSCSLWRHCNELNCISFSCRLYTWSRGIFSAGLPLRHHSGLKTRITHQVSWFNIR